MSHILFLSQRMMRGFGVDVVIHNVGMHLRRLGHEVTVACIEVDGSYHGLRLVRVPPDPHVVARLASGVGASVIVAHTSPFFEMLPALQRDFTCWAWEHGDPTPSLFDADRDDRVRIKNRKIDSVYPAVRGVIAISQFIRSDICLPSAHIIYNGCDHTPDFGTKGLQDFPPPGTRPLRIGTLMRLGQGEAHYKGNALFVELADSVRKRGIEAQFCVMGRGTREDADLFTNRGFEVYLNASDETKWSFLRELDVFISCSLWEGFNLPLVEALASGTVGLAFDTGAHSEVTPFVLSSMNESVELIAFYAANPALMLAHSHIGYSYARHRFRWIDAALAFQELVGLRVQHAAVSNRTLESMTNLILAPIRIGLNQVLGSLSNDGLRATSIKIMKRLRGSHDWWTRH